MSPREKYFLGADGKKYPRYNMEWNIHSHGTKMYSNTERRDLELTVYPLPKSAYPFRMIYEGEEGDD